MGIEMLVRRAGIRCLCFILALVVSLGLLWPTVGRAANVYVGDLSGANVFQFAEGAGGSLTALSPASVANCATSHTGTGGVVVSPDGKSVYAFCGLDSIEQYDVGSGGALTPKSSATVSSAGDGGFEPWGRDSAQSLAISPNGENVYALGGGGDNNVYQFTVGAGGELSAMSPATVAAGAGPSAIVVSPDGAHVYVVNGGYPFGSGGISVYNVGAGGALTSEAGAAVEGNANTLAISPDGSSLYVAGNDPCCSDADFLDQFSVDSSTGALTAKSPKTLTPPSIGTCSEGGSALAVSPNGQNVYLGTVEDATGSPCTGSDADSTEIVEYSVGSGGALTQASVTDTGGLIGDIAINPDGAYLFASESSDPGGTPAGSDDLKRFAIGSGGSLSDGTAYTGWTDPGAIAITPAPASPQSLLTVSKAGSGSGTVSSADGGISCGGSCSHSYTQGTMVTLTATPTAGSTFAGWSGGDCSGIGTCVVTMSSTQSVTATFNTQVSPRSTLSVAKAGAGSGTVTSSPAGITCGAICSHSYTQGTIVTLTAAPAGGSTFAGWSSGGCSGTGRCMVMMSSTRSVTATFNIQQNVRLIGSPKSTTTGVSDKIKCTAPAGQSCHVTERLTTIETVIGGQPLVVTAASKRKTKTVVIGSKTVTIPAGHTTTVTIKLNTAGRKLLERFGKLPATLTIKLNRGGKLVTVASRKVTIKQSKK